MKFHSQQFSLMKCVNFNKVCYHALRKLKKHVQFSEAYLV